MSGRTCWICGASGLELVKPADDVRMKPESFAITNSDYGRTGAIYACGECGFRQCSDLPDVVSQYEELVDPSYEESRPARAIQERRLIAEVRRHKKGGRLFDVGAASGVLIEEAGKAGFDAEGVEPSRWLQAEARKRGLRVHLGTLPHPDVKPPYDAVTVVDVVEHVTDPRALAAECAKLLGPGGTLVVVTPDRDSVAARLLGRRWWHYRLAHVGYFNLKNLDRLFASAGLERVAASRPAWFFPADYLIERVCRYVPKFLRLKPPASLGKIVVPLNLRDSILAVYRKK